jgi:hypothetical protein
VNNLFTDLSTFSEKFLKVQSKTGEIVPLVLNDVQRRCLGELTERTLILKARQMGVSTLIQAEIFRRLITQPTSALTLSHSDSTTQLLRDIGDRYYKYLPEFSDVAKIQRTQANARVTKFDEMNSRHVVGTAGSADFGRGGSFNFFHGSEVAFWENAESIISGALQGGDPMCVFESTPNGSQGWFYEAAMEALAGRGPWKLLFYPWWTDKTYFTSLEADQVTEFNYTDEEAALVKKHGLTAEQIAWRRTKQSELKRMFYQEYPEDPVECFLTSGAGYFGSILRGAFTAPFGAEYQPGHVYTMGVDFGQSNDATYAPVFDRTVGCQVDYLHINKLSWSEQRRRIKALHDKWHVQSVLAEANSIGSVNIEQLRSDGVHVLPFWTDNASKAALMGIYYDHLERGLKLLDWPVQKSEHYSFVSTQLPSGVWRLAASGDQHDDTVIGNALAIAAPYAGIETVIIEQRDPLEEMSNAY